MITTFTINIWNLFSSLNFIQLHFPAKKFYSASFSSHHISKKTKTKKQYLMSDTSFFFFSFSVVFGFWGGLVVEKEICKK